MLYNYHIVTYQQADWQDTYYLVRPEYAKNCTDNLINGLADRNAAGVAFRDIGNLLSADYYVNNIVTREQVKEMNVQSLKEAVEKGLAVSIKEGPTRITIRSSTISARARTGTFRAARAVLKYSLRTCWRTKGEGRTTKRVLRR